jgi:predicted dehydrogenase
MSSRVRSSRRRFLGGAAAVFTAPYFVPSSVLGKDGATAPSERITLGMIGVGKMGQGHCGAMGGHKEIQIVAICDVDKMSRDEAHAKVVESHKARNKPTDIALYNDFREVLARKDIDAVLIATPDHWHAIPVIEACKAGKDIYCEKPMSLTVAEAWQMHDAVRKHNVVFQTGSQQRSDARFRHACQLVRNGYIGELKTVHANVGGPSKWCDLPEEPVPAGLDWDRWLGQAPVRPFNAVLRPPHNNNFPNWRGYREYSGGMMTDWGAHHFDIGQWGIGADGSGPIEIIAKKDKEPLTYVYASGAKMLHAGQAGDQKVDGVLFTGTEGWVMVNRGKLSASTEELANYKTFPWKESDTKLYASSSHHQDWIDAMRKRTRPICDVEIGASSVSVCHLGNISYWTGQSFKYDPKKRQITDNAECNALLTREQRSPYTVPAV